MTERYFVLGPVLGTPYTRYAVLHGEQTVWTVQVSRPDGREVPRPDHLRWRHGTADVAVRTKVDYQQFAIGNHNGEQPRRATWSRAGRRAAAEAAL